MKKLRSTLVLLLALILGQSSIAQEKQVFFDVSILSQPDQFNFHYQTSETPGFEFNLGYRSVIKQSPFIWEAQVSYLYAQAELYEDNFFPINTNDPNIPDEVTYKFSTSVVGFKSGIGFRIASQGRNNSLSIIVGASGYLPFLSTVKTKYDDNDWQKRPRYTKDEFKYGILYGAYFKPSYQFALSKEPTPLRFSIFAEVDWMWRNQATYGNPRSMVGGGLGVCYSLK